MGTGLNRAADLAVTGPVGAYWAQLLNFGLGDGQEE